MQIVGEWLRCDDGVTRPAIFATISGGNGNTAGEYFLIDSGADRTVFRATLPPQLGLGATGLPFGVVLQGITGSTTFVLIRAVIEFVRDDARAVAVRGEFAAFTDPAATDLSILGRDVLDNFDVILSRRRDAVLLLAPNHRYAVARD